MDDKKNSAMIALLPTTCDWCKIDLPHMTLVYAGELDTLKPNAYNDLAKDASSLALLSRPLTLNVVGLDVYGQEEQVDVLKLHASTELLAMRELVEHWNASQFPFKPHVTVGPQGSFSGEIPTMLHFDHLLVGWGDQSLTFRLKM